MKTYLLLYGDLEDWRHVNASLMELRGDVDIDIDFMHVYLLA